MINIGILKSRSSKTGYSEPPLSPLFRKGGREVIVFQKKSEMNLESRHIEGGEQGMRIIAVSSIFLPCKGEIQLQPERGLILIEL